MSKRSTMIAVATVFLTNVAFGQTFVNFETPHVSPLDMTPDGSKLLAVNTADNRLEVFALTPAGPVKAGSIPVGLDPVTVRARTNTEAWVVNHISDSVSIVDLQTLRVTNTISVGDEPTDVVFAGAPQKAFVSLSQLNQVKVYDSLTLALVSTLPIQGEDPRALATDGTSVYAAIFESGTDTTILPFQTVSSAVNPYPGDPNPPPNDGVNFNPPKNPVNPTPPAVSLIVKKTGVTWMDDNNGNWTPAVTWNLHGHDVAVINANSLAVSYVNSLMSANMHIAVKPSGQVTVVGTDAINHVRFEPNVQGIFVRAVGATFPAGGGAPAITDLNPHLDYATPNIPQPQRNESIGDPRGIAWKSNSNRAYITGMGSNNIIAVDGGFARVGRVQVGQGPTGVRIDEARNFVYVLNKFDATISVVNEAALTLVANVPMHDPTPQAIRDGRPFLYDTHLTSGLGQASCASCHIDARMDQLAWDLGDPAGDVKLFNQTCQVPLGGACENWHPMKGPMATQTLVGILGTGPLHWRGDRENLAAFNPAFIGLLGDDAVLSPAQMNQFTNFIGTIRFPPQPNRNFDNSLKTTFPNTGNPQIGEQRFLNQPIDGGFLTCVFCHAMPTGTNGQITPAQALQDTQSVKVPQLRNMYEKTGFFVNSQSNDRGFGFIKDGSVDTLFAFLQFSGFNFNQNPQPPAPADQQRRDIEAFLLSFPTGTHAAIGVQTTVLNGGAVPGPQQTLINSMIAQANLNSVGLVVKGLQQGIARGYTYVGSNNFQSDRSAQTVAAAALLASASNGSELTYTVVPKGSENRIGIDRDQDGYFDRDELDVCSNPANPLSTPANVCVADVSPAGLGDGVVNVGDLLAVINAWGASGPIGSVSGDCAPGCGDGTVNVGDLLAVINAWGACP